MSEGRNEREEYQMMGGKAADERKGERGRDVGRETEWGEVRT